MLKLVFKVKPETEIVLPFFTGHLIQGVLLRSISKLNFRLADELHKPNQMRWYAIEPLDGPKGRNTIEKGMWKISPNELYRFAFSFFGPEEKESELIDLISIISNELHIGITKFHVDGISVNKMSYKALIEKGVKLDNKLIVSFKTPVQFKSKYTSRPLLLPMPEYIISSIGRLWNAFSDVKVDLDELIPWAKAHVFIRAHKLKTQEVNIGKTALQVGFRGYILVIIDDGDFCEWVKTLLLFSEFSNIGSKRTIGMGVVRVKSPLEKTRVSTEVARSVPIPA